MEASSSDAKPDRTEYMLTTYDNPFDPFTQWDQWYAYDRDLGYHTPGLLARISLSSPELSELDQHVAIQNAIDEIVRENVTGVHMKVKRDDIIVPITVPNENANDELQA